MKCAERIEELRESVLKPTGQKDKRAELHSLKKNRSELPPSERSPITGECFPKEQCSFILGKSLRMFPDVHTDLRRIAQGIEPRIEKAHPAAAEWGFPVSSLSSRLVWSQLRQTLYQANESAKSPSPSLAGQSVIVNQAGLLAPVHRSFASSRGLPSDCQLALACEFAPCYSGVTAPAYEIILSLPDSL